MLVGLSACSLEVTGRSNLSYWSERMTFDRRNSMLCCGKGIVDSVGNGMKTLRGHLLMKAASLVPSPGKVRLRLRP